MSPRHEIQEFSELQETGSQGSPDRMFSIESKNTETNSGSINEVDTLKAAGISKSHHLLRSWTRNESQSTVSSLSFCSSSSQCQYHVADAIPNTSRVVATPIFEAQSSESPVSTTGFQHKGRCPVSPTSAPSFPFLEYDDGIVDEVVSLASYSDYSDFGEFGDDSCFALSAQEMA